jgi:ribonucleotide reductase alpha subunit
MLFKDQANAKSNQKHLGTIKSSNLCCEIMEYTAPDEIAVCNLASISLPRYVKDGEFDFETLHSVVKVIVKNLNKIIDGNYYPCPEARYSNMRHRPIGIGIQGLADCLQLMKMSFEDEGTYPFNQKLFETMYHASMTASMELAKELGPYETFKGSPLSQGLFQFDMWNDVPPTKRYDWDQLRNDVMQFGARNSLLLAPMPTASTSQILGNNESFEPYTSNIYTRRVLAGEFVCVNPHLVKDLIALGLWTEDIRNQLVANNGSVLGLSQIPDRIQ